MDTPNLLIIMDDEHRGDALGCAGHPLVQTPNIDRLAARGTQFANAYTNSPICVPARAVLATGRYAHQTGYWDNCIAYDGATPSWGHALQSAQHPVTSIGKLHYLDDECPTGFDRQILPMHIHDGGDTHGLVRDDPPTRPQCRDLAENIGAGETEYTDYDRNIAAAACAWLRERAASANGRPWTTFVSFICPHYPLVAPKEFFELYDPARIPLPKKRPDDGTAATEWWQAFENCYIWDRFFESDAQRRIAMAAYYGLISFIDDNVGTLLQTLEDCGLDKTTRVIFLSDHGENLGARGLWGKSTMYNESVTIPMLAAGPGVPAGVVRRTPVSLLDIYPTVLDNAGLAVPEDRPGRSLFDLAALPDDIARLVFSEYHATAAKSAEFMLRRGRYKYIHYVGYPPELYDLEDDPEELCNLARRDSHAGLIREFEGTLRGMLDPEAVDRAAKTDQERLIERYGGREAVIAKGGKSATPAPEAVPDSGSAMESAK
ncbi:sulfatase-like hydrolase/transferase [Pelagibius sp.]|uniref:sulfatase-like hydrolase/transferase n=1 Tax=Pelagibius sp. TaxID=1931238 RepID=UPI00261B09B2|nr:sulfatase-like hydrolase/transferase [Pelagibius sp.]